MKPPNLSCVYEDGDFCLLYFNPRTSDKRNAVPSSRGNSTLAELKKMRIAENKYALFIYLFIFATRFLSSFLLWSSGFYCDPTNSTSALLGQLVVVHLPCKGNYW